MIYLIKTDGTFDTYNNVIEWTNSYVVFKSGKGTAKIYAGGGEYFTDVTPEI
jgi:hypothetical protein